MSKSTRHVYEVTHVERPDETNVVVGGHLVDTHHVRKYCEPERVWHFMDMKTGTAWSIKGKHIGEYEKVRHLFNERGGQ